MKNDELEKMTDEQLSEVFAEEVAGWVWWSFESPNGNYSTLLDRRSTWPEHWAKKGDCKRGKLYELQQIEKMPFATSADAVLPFLCKVRSEIAVHDDGVMVTVTQPYGECWLQTNFTEDETPKGWRNRRPEPPDVARSACIALILATRAAAEAKEGTK